MAVATKTYGAHLVSRQLKSLGYDPTIDQLVTMRIHGVTTEFVMTDGQSFIPVRYRGITPDLFKEGSGAVAEGHLVPFGITGPNHNPRYGQIFVAEVGGIPQTEIAVRASRAGRRRGENAENTGDCGNRC